MARGFWGRLFSFSLPIHATLQYFRLILGSTTVSTLFRISAILIALTYTFNKNRTFPKSWFHKK